jgi:hypothetical protein
MVKVLDRESINRMTRNSGRGGSTYVGGGGGGSYTLPVAADGTLGGVKLGYPTSAANRYYAVQLDDQQRAYVNVPWTSVSFGTDGNDYVPITIGSATKNVLTAHQSLAGYATESWVTQRGYATQSWVNQNFITVEWFDKLFKLYNGAESDVNKIAPNGTLPSDPANLNIEAMFGFWTKKYISALGNGDDGTTSYTTLAQLNDVTLTNPTADQVLSYNGTHWVNRTLSLGSQTLADLTDVVITSPAANQMLSYDATTQKWVNAAIPATGVTSVALSMPTGFSITGSPITASGTFTVTFASGYSLPTTAKQSNWDTAYGWGDHASAGYVKSSGVTSVATGTGLTGGTITGSGTISINSTYQTYISHGESAYNSLGNYIPKHNISGTSATIPTWGTLTAANGYSSGINWDFSGGGAIAWAYKGGEAYMQIDGCFYQNEGRYRVIDTSDVSGLSVNYANSAYSSSYSTYATYLNASYSNGDTTWTWNPLNQTQYYTWGQQFKNANVSTDTADMRFYIAANNTSAGGLGLWLNIDGGINALTSLYAGEYVQVGNIKMVYDSTNNAIKVIKSDGTAANFYATGGVSALGAGQEGSGNSYLPLSGGTLTNTASDILTLNSTGAENASFVLFNLSGTNKADVGYSQNFAYVSNNVASGARIGVNNSGTPQYWDGAGASKNIYNLIHSGGGNFTGGLTFTKDGLLFDILRYDSDYGVDFGWRYSNKYGAGIALRSVNCTDVNQRGAFIIYAQNSSTVKNLTGKCDGTLTWDGAMYATGYNNTSDIRKKNVIKDTNLRIEQIAKAPAFEYYWLDPSIDHDLHVGTSAQYWESVLPQVVTTAKDEMGTLSMQYGVAALISAITVARKVMTHEEEIALLKTRVSALEKENGELIEELNKIKAA